MKLSDVVSHSGLAGYAVVALILFFTVFVAVVARILLASRREMDRAARLPLDDDASAAEREGERS